MVEVRVEIAGRQDSVSEVTVDADDRRQPDITPQHSPVVAWAWARSSRGPETPPLPLRGIEDPALHPRTPRLGALRAGIRLRQEEAGRVQVLASAVVIVERECTVLRGVIRGLSAHLRPLGELAVLHAAVIDQRLAGGGSATFRTRNARRCDFNHSIDNEAAIGSRGVRDPIFELR
jgi:hypothetical protein